MFQRAKTKKKFAKVGLYGKSGAGKTHLSLTFPKPAVIDPERGTDFFANRFDFHVVQPNSYDEIMAAVSFIESGFKTEEFVDPILRRKATRLTQERTGVHDFETLIIDPVTVVWDLIQFEQLLKVERSNRKNTEDYAQKDWGEMKRAYKSLLNRLIALPMHIVVIGRLGEVRDSDTGKVVAERMDAEKSTEYNFDVTMKLVNLGGDQRVGIIDKDRSGLYKVGDRVENPSFDTFKAILARLESVSPVKAMADTWRERGITDDQARAEIKRLTGKERSADLTPEEIVALTDHFRTWQPEGAPEAAAAAV